MKNVAKNIFKWFAHIPCFDGPITGKHYKCPKKFSLNTFKSRAKNKERFPLLTCKILNKFFRILLVFQKIYVEKF